MKAAWSDLGLALATVAGAALLVVGAAKLPPPRFEPMGSAALPRILGGLLILFAFIIAVNALRQILSQTPAPRKQSPPSATVAKPAFGRAALLLVILVLYVASLDLLRWPFVPVTTVFVALVGSLLSRPSLRSLFVFGLFGLCLAALVYAVFTRFLYVDLA